MQIEIIDNGVWFRDADYGFNLFLDNVEVRGYTVDNLITKLTMRQIQTGTIRKVDEKAKEDGA